MKTYEYKFIKVPKIKGMKTQSGDTFEECKSIISQEAKNGWRLKQVVEPINEKTGIYSPDCYEIIFEKAID